jgi:hypothetical protein
MSEHKKKLIEQIKKMPLEELITYQLAAKNTSRFINVLGILTLCVMMIFTNIFTLIIGFILIYIAGNLGVMVDETLNVLREQIEKS